MREESGERRDESAFRREWRGGGRGEESGAGDLGEGLRNRREG